jgi:hypothetical protein
VHVFNATTAFPPVQFKKEASFLSRRMSAAAATTNTGLPLNGIIAMHELLQMWGEVSALVS